MAHKFAHRWRVFSIVFNAQNLPVFVPKGVMDLKNMSPEGILVDGEYEDSVSGNEFKIKGKANELGGLMSLTLENVDKPIESWNGLLIFEKGNTMKIGGSRIVTTTLAAQDEEPWLITKP